ncbi:hypothetical protein PMAYCL1PPCAC_19507, partial [Pristionchus mayeri]
IAPRLALSYLLLCSVVQSELIPEEFTSIIGGEFTAPYVDRFDQPTSLHGEMLASSTLPKDTPFLSRISLPSHPLVETPSRMDAIGTNERTGRFSRS